MSKQVVIIGCGPAGVAVANGLAKQADAGKVQVTILEKKDHVDLCTPHPRSMVNEKFADEVLLKHDRAVFGKARQIVNVKQVKSIVEGEVSCTTSGGEVQKFPADAIVIATGSSYKGEYIKNDEGLHKDAWLQKLSKWRAAAGRAKHILIVGGGITGVELAGELATEHPTCKITLIHSQKYVGNQDEKFHKAALWGFSTLPGKVEVITEDKVEVQEFMDTDSPKTLTTKNGRAITDIDMCVMCTGVSPNTDFLDASKLNERREIVVDDTMQAPALTSAACPIFAVGDVTQCGWGRAMIADKMAKACVANLLNLIAGKPLKNVYETEKKPFLPVMISLGRTQGVANVPFVNNRLARWVKAPTLMAGLIWPKMMGVKDFSFSEQARGPSPLVSVSG